MIRGGVAVAMLLFCFSTDFPKAHAQSTAPSATVTDFEGQPPKHDKQLKRPRYFLWHDADGWHLHTKTGGGGHTFAGTIRIAGAAKIYDLRGIGGLEKKKDFGAVNGVENAIDFQFKTKSAGDGLDFKVGNGATRIEFDLKIDGYSHPEQIDVGSKGSHPANAAFTIPLTPKIQ